MMKSSVEDWEIQEENGMELYLFLAENEYHRANAFVVRNAVESGEQNENSDDIDENPVIKIEIKY